MRKVWFVAAVPLEKAADAYARMMAGKAVFRMVLTMDHPSEDRGTILRASKQG